MMHSNQATRLSAFGQTESMLIQSGIRSTGVPRRVGRWLSWLALLLLSALSSPSLTAATATWGGLGADNNWTTPANWVGGVAPVAGDDLVFAGATRLTPSNDFAANTSFKSISFASGSSAFTVGGNGITLAGNITNGSANTQTITVPMTLNVATATMTGSSTIILSGVISEIGGARAIAKTGTGTLTLSGANTYTGATTALLGFAWVCSFPVMA